jgi:antitoxin component of RelBE/YafQ-DinJ toxin-antitoxin module
MSDSTTLSVRIKSTLREALDSASEDLRTSRSELVRTLLREAVVEGDLDIPEHLRVLAEREAMKDANRVRDLRGGYSGRVKKQLHSRYHSGDYSASDIEDLAQNYRREARILWPEWSETDYAEEREEALAVVSAQVSKYQALEEVGAEVSLDGGTDLEDLRADADRLLADYPRGRVISMLSDRPGADRSDAVEAVEAVDPTRDSEEPRSTGSSPTPDGEITDSGAVETDSPEGLSTEDPEDIEPGEEVLEEVEHQLAQGTAPNVVVSVVSAPEEEALAALREVRSEPEEVSADD